MWKSFHPGLKCVSFFLLLLFCQSCSVSDLKNGWYYLFRGSEFKIYIHIGISMRTLKIALTLLMNLEKKSSSGKGYWHSLVTEEDSEVIIMVQIQIEKCKEKALVLIQWWNILQVVKNVCQEKD